MSVMTDLQMCNSWTYGGVPRRLDPQKFLSSLDA